MSDLLKEAISNWYWSPFKPAPILENFKMEFNILRIEAFHELLSSLRTTEIVKLKSDFCFYRSRLMRGMLALFNHQARSRYDYQGHLAIRFSRPQMKRAHKEMILNEGKWFKPDWHITNAKEIQFFKRSRAIPDIVEARRENAMEHYIQHDIGSVINHFY